MLVAWRLFEKLKTGSWLAVFIGYELFQKIVKWLLLSASLGGLDIRYQYVEMASGYATLENDGKYREPTCIVKILDSDGNEIVSIKSSKRVFTRRIQHVRWLIS